MDNNFAFAIILALLAGLSTGLGGILSFFVKKNNMNALSIGLGFSAGVMIYISFVEILKKSGDSLCLYLGESSGELVNLVAFFIGIGIAALIDHLIPDHVDPDMLKESSITDKEKKQIFSKEKLARTGVFTALAISLHNFPEGLATFMSALNDPALGISIAIAIAIHNIPEGIAVSLPIYYSTGSKKTALKYAFLSGLAEPAGAIIGYFLFAWLFNDLAFGLIFSAVAGIMIYISLDELLPMAREYGSGHLEILGVVLGMMIISVSLILF
ncbi:MAG: zinc transporter ZupT [Cyanobacteriota bacterium]